MSAMTARRLALLALLGLAGAAFALVITSVDQGYRVRVQMADAAGLRKDFLVKIAGAPVGKVLDVGLDDEDHALALLDIDEGAAPIGADARAAIRASNLLGEKYVDLTPGSLADPVPSGSTIPLTRASTPSDLDDVLSVLDPDTRVALGAFLVGQGDALVGRGKDLADTLVEMPPALDAAQKLVAGLSEDNRALGSLVERSDRIAASLVPERQALGRLITSAEGAFVSIDSRRTALGAALESGPAAVRELREALVELERAAGPLGPASRGLEATAAPLTDTLRELPSFVNAARPTLRTARSVAPMLGRLAREASPVVNRLGPAGKSLRTFAKSLRPVSNLLDDGVADTLGVLQGWARSIQNRDGVGHVFRVSVELGGDMLNTLDSYVKGPEAAKRSDDGDGKARAAEAKAKNAPAGSRGQRKAKPSAAAEKKSPQPRAKASQDGAQSSSGDPVKRLLDYLLKP